MQKVNDGETNSILMEGTMKVIFEEGLVNGSKPFKA